MVGQTLLEQGVEHEIVPPYYSVKEAVFPFIKFPGVDPVLGPEMKSTGEVMGVGVTFGEAYHKALMASGVTIPRSGVALISVRTVDQPAVIDIARYLQDNGFELVATEGTAASLRTAGMNARVINKVREGSPHVLESIRNDEFDLIVNTTASRPNSHQDAQTIRREALLHEVTYFTTLSAARAACDAHRTAGKKNTVSRLQSLHQMLGI
jgi:carbamoyl-phosphate synthase large subunit